MHHDHILASKSASLSTTYYCMCTCTQYSFCTYKCMGSQESMNPNFRVRLFQKQFSDPALVHAARDLYNYLPLPLLWTVFVRCGCAPPQESFSHPSLPLSCAGWPASQPAGLVWTPVTQQWTEAAARLPQAHAGNLKTVHLAVQRQEWITSKDDSGIICIAWIHRTECVLWYAIKGVCNIIMPVKKRVTQTFCQQELTIK